MKAALEISGVFADLVRAEGQGRTGMRAAIEGAFRAAAPSGREAEGLPCLDPRRG